MSKYTPQQIEDIRRGLTEDAEKLLGIPYKIGAEWTDLAQPPALIDCSEMVEGLCHKRALEMPDGAVNQYNFLKQYPAANPTRGDIGFFIERDGQHDRPKGTVYHSGMIFDASRVIEARGKPYDKVIFRPIIAWREFKNFGGWYSHPDLIV